MPAANEGSERNLGDEPLVSVVMPCFNHGKFVAESAASILGQTHANLELIIVDDGSRDDAREVIRGLAARDPRVRFSFHERNMGASASRNDGIGLARGEFVGFCDADDLWMPDKVAVQLAALRRSPEYDVAYCDSIIIDENGATDGRRFSGIYPRAARPSGRLFEELCQRNFINMQTVMLRRSCLSREALFDSRIRWVEDWWFWIGLSSRHLFLETDRPLAKYRVHSRSTSATQHRGIEANRLKVFARILGTFPDLTWKARAQVWYHMAASLEKLGWRAASRRYLRASAAAGLRSPAAWPPAARAVARLITGFGGPVPPAGR